MASQTSADLKTKAAGKSHVLAAKSDEAATFSTERLEKYKSIARQFGYELTYNRDRMIDEARHYMGESGRAMLEAGARLALIRSQEQRGEWIEVCEQLGLDRSTASRMISAASKFTNGATSHHFERIGGSKLFELLVLDDDDADLLVNGGAVEGLGGAGDIANMTVKELRATLRDMREENTAKDSVLAAKNIKIDSLQTQLERKKKDTPVEEWAWAPARRDLLDACEHLAIFAQSELRRALVGIQDQAEAEGKLPEDIDALRGQALSSVMQTLVTIQNDYGIAVDLDGIVVPAWAQSEHGYKKK